MKGRSLLFACIILASVPAVSESADRAAIEEFSGYNISITPFLARESFQLAIKTDDEKLAYSPNVQWRWGSGLYVYGAAFYFITDVPGDSMMKEEETHGKSDSLDVLAHFYSRDIGIDFAFQRAKGFYLDKQNPSGAPGARYLFPDMTSLALGVNVYYLFSGESYSMRAAYDQGERQNVSGGSFVIMASLHYFSIENDGSIIPAEYSAAAGRLAGFEKGRFFTATLGPGYAYTVAISNFFISPAFFFGIGGQYRDYTTAAGDESNGKLPLKINWRMALGYNGDSVIAGARFLVDYTMVPLGGAQLQAYTLEATIFAGIRI